MGSLLKDNKIKLIVLVAVKCISVVLVVVFLASLFGSGKQSTTSIEDMTTAVTSAADMSNMQQADNQMIKRLYGLNPDDYDGITLYYPVTNMGAEEILIVKLKSEDQKSAVQDAMDARIQTQKNSFDGYGAEQTEMLENCVIKVEGNYILLVVAGDTSSVVTAFEDAL